MGNDRMAAIREQRRLSKDRSRRSFSYVNAAEAERQGIVQWRPQPGDNFIFIVPAVDPKTKYFAKEIYVHSQVGPDNLTFLCLRRMKEEACPICEELVELRKSNSGDPRLGVLAPKLRFLFLVVDVKDRETEKKGIRWYDAPGMVNDGILGLSENKRTGAVTDVSDPANKLCITFTRVGTKKTTKYESFTLEQYQDGDIPKSWCTEIPNFDDLLQFSDYKIISDAFVGYDKDQTEDDDSAPAEGTRKSAEGTRKSSQEKEEVDREEPAEVDDVTSRVRARMEKEDTEAPRRERMAEGKSREERPRDSRTGQGRTEEKEDRRERRGPAVDSELEPEQEQPRRAARRGQGDDLDD